VLSPAGPPTDWTEPDDGDAGVGAGAGAGAGAGVHGWRPAAGSR
jgi:hypothetical protein